MLYFYDILLRLNKYIKTYFNTHYPKQQYRTLYAQQ
jgi:hypothetical protein